MEEKLSESKHVDSDDPFEWMDGLADLHEADLASRADEILYRDASVH